MVLSFLVTLVHMMFGGDAPDFTKPNIYQVEFTGFYQDYTAWTILIPLFLQNLFLGSALDVTPIGEETGWRGFALPHLQGRCNALVSSVILGLIWGLWQWPLYWNIDPSVGTSYGYIFLGVVPAAVLATWIFNSTGGSLLMVLLYSNSLKMTDWFFPSAVGVHPLVTIVVFWMVAVGVILWTGPTKLTRRELGDWCVEGGSTQDIPPALKNLPPQ
jgi:membrane protease YdiL (CAAX protease family)